MRTSMTYKEFINRPTAISRRIDHKQAEASKCFDACVRTTAAPREVMIKSGENARDVNLARYIDAQAELAKLHEDFKAVAKVTRSFLYDALKPDVADLMEYRYVDCCTVNEIAAMKSMAPQSVRNKISRGNKEAEKYWEEQSGYRML